MLSHCRCICWFKQTVLHANKMNKYILKILPKIGSIMVFAAGLFIYLLINETCSCCGGRMLQILLVFFFFVMLSHIAVSVVWFGCRWFGSSGRKLRRQESGSLLVHCLQFSNHESGKLILLLIFVV